MNKLIISALVLTIATGIGAYLFGSVNKSQVYAYNGGNGSGMRQGLQDKATLFGISFEELNKLRESGKTMLDIAKEKGITEDTFHQKVQESAVARWQSRGFTEEEIQERLAQMKERQENCDGTGNNGGMMGKSQGRGQGNGLGRN